ncbi:hypothetical protein DSO57_1021853 [Entomophthora muscae]|uniref:Uncharacterized protein n=1 Tax=Entomophthora muscae TaxID=34485 RepID=A0ACC2S5C2_9FUNG|nr:hypothetical protein DSO57_1021853 [Entomophthora muscae]
MAPLSIRKISGIGRVTERVLNAVGVETCQDAYDKHAILFSLFSEKTFNFVFASCLGISSSHLNSDHVRKSISTERTFSSLSTLEELSAKLKELSQSLASSLERKHISGRTVTLKIKTPAFEVKVRSRTLPHFISSQADLFDAGKKLLEQEYPISARLMGLRLSTLSNFEPEPSSTITKYLVPSHGSLSSNPVQMIDSDSSDVEIVIKDHPSKVQTNHDTLRASKASNVSNSSTSATESICCPVCAKTFPGGHRSLDQLNSHLDKCLSANDSSLAVPPPSSKKYKPTKKSYPGSPKDKDLFSFFSKKPPKK